MVKQGTPTFLQDLPDGYPLSVDKDVSNRGKTLHALADVRDGERPRVTRTVGECGDGERDRGSRDGAVEVNVGVGEVGGRDGDDV